MGNTWETMGSGLGRLGALVDHRGAVAFPFTAAARTIDRPLEQALVLIAESVKDSIKLPDSDPAACGQLSLAENGMLHKCSKYAILVFVDEGQLGVADAVRVVSNPEDG
jgi:hypothetical protein